MSLILRDDSIANMCLELAGRNPGATRVLVDYVAFLNNEERVRPALQLLNSAGITGGRVWMLYKDVCRENIECFAKVLDATRRGEIPAMELDTAIDNRGRGIDIAKYS